MDLSIIRKGLLAIREKFCRIQEMTAGIDATALQEEIEAVVAERGVVIDQIADQRRMLTAADPAWEREAARSRALADIMHDIDRIILSVKAMDDRIAAACARRLAVIRNEMKGIYHHSRAAYAYTSHARPSYRNAQWNNALS